MKTLLVILSTIFLPFSTAIAKDSISSTSNPRAIIKKVDLISLRKVIKKDENLVKSRLLTSVYKNIDNKNKIDKLVTNLRAINLELGNYVYTAHYLLVQTRENFKQGTKADETSLLKDLIKRSELLLSTPLAMHSKEYLDLEILSDQTFITFLKQRELDFFKEYREQNKDNLFGAFNLLQNVDYGDPRVVSEVNKLFQQLIETDALTRKELEKQSMLVIGKVKAIPAYEQKASNLLAAYLLDALESGKLSRAEKLYNRMQTEFPAMAAYFKKLLGKNEKVVKSKKKSSSFLSNANKITKTSSFPFGLLFLLIIPVAGYLILRRNKNKINNEQHRTVIDRDDEEPKFDELLDLAGVGN